MAEFRCYTFTLWQLSPIQQGIQSGHAAVELVTYHQSNPAVQSWARTYKTMILLGGGEVSELNELIVFLSNPNNPFAWKSFRESQESLGGLITSVAIVLPDRIYVAAEALRRAFPVDLRVFSVWEQELIDRLRNSSLAR